VTPDFAALRQTMVEGQIRTYDVTETRLVAALEFVPREAFVPEARRAVAYVDQPVSLSARRSMLTPMVLARMIQALDVAPGDHCLDVACGSGYSTAILARLGASVVALEDDSSAVRLKETVLGLSGAAQVRHVNAALAAGAPDLGPFDVILVNGAVEAEPEALFAQLREGGRLVVVMGGGRSGRATLFRKSHHHVSGMPVFDASAPMLDEFRLKPAFVF
jgi:protein-L-isoaspartate(D-aspartate) O-methyltransferase